VKDGLSYSHTVAHLRWDLKQVFDLALSDGYVTRNPATKLLVPRHARRPVHRILNVEEVKTIFSLLDLRERLIAGLAIIAGLRPGEILGLVWRHLDEGRIEIQQRLYRGRIDTPKSIHSKRWAGISQRLVEWIEEWRGFHPDARPSAWVFPSERMTTPLSRDNVWRRGFLSKTFAQCSEVAAVDLDGSIDDSEFALCLAHIIMRAAGLVPSLEPLSFKPILSAIACPIPQRNVTSTSFGKVLP